MSADNIAKWIYKKGLEDNIILYSKVSIYRNIDNIRFYNHIDKDDIEKIDTILTKEIEELRKLDIHLEKIKLRELLPLEIKLLKENLTIPNKRNLLNASLYIDEDEETSILINSNEHCEIQTIARGLEIEECFNRAYKIESMLDKKIDFAFNKKFGYLTSSPEKIGIAMNLTVSMAIPALIWKTPDNIEYFINRASKKGFDISIRAGKTIPVLNITNKTMMGISEKDILNSMLEIVNYILDKEKKMRLRIKNMDRLYIEDKVYRSTAILSNARVMNYMEFIKHNLWLRVGLDCNIIDNIDLDDLDTLSYMIFISKNNHLKLMFNNKKKYKNTSEMRAAVLREIMNPQ